MLAGCLPPIGGGRDTMPNHRDTIALWGTRTMIRTRAMIRRALDRKALTRIRRALDRKAIVMMFRPHMP